MESRVRPDAGFGTFAARAPLRLQGDVLNQLRHVGAAAERLLTIQDRDPCSPSFGSCGAAASLPPLIFAKASKLRVTKTINISEPDPRLEVELGHG